MKTGLLTSLVAQSLALMGGTKFTPGYHSSTRHPTQDRNRSQVIKRRAAEKANKRRGRGK